MPDLEQIRQMTEQFPDDPMLRFALGQKLLEEFPEDQEKLREACEHFAFVVDEEPSNAANALSWGKALVKLGENREAKKVLEDGLVQAHNMADSGKDIIPAMEELLRSL